MSMGKAQALAAADGFLDSLGSEEGLEPRETISELYLIAGEFAEDMQNNLEASKSNATGELSKSIVLNPPVQVGNSLHIDIMMLFYGRFVNRGVKGTKGGSGQYSFKTDYPPRKMVESVRAWIKFGKSKSSNINPLKTTSISEKKSHSIGQIDDAYHAARSILQYGIDATGFLDKAAITTRNKVSDRLGAALKIDIINSIKS